MVTNRNDIGTKFETGDVPSQADFKEIFDSFVHKDEDKATAAMVDAGIDDEHYVTPALLRLGLQNIGAITGGGNLPYKQYNDDFNGMFIGLDKLPIESSVKVFKNGQLLQEDDDYTIDYETATVLFTVSVVNRNIEIDYWYKSSDPIPGNGTNYVDLTTNQTIFGMKGFADVTDFTGVVIDNGGSNRGLHVINNGDVEGVLIRSTDSGDSLIINDSVTATGIPLQIQKDDVTKFSVDGTGKTTASSFVKSGATSNDVLLGDGTTISLSGLGSGSTSTLISMFEASNNEFILDKGGNYFNLYQSNDKSGGYYQNLWYDEVHTASARISDIRGNEREIVLNSRMWTSPNTVESEIRVGQIGNTEEYDVILKRGTSTGFSNVVSFEKPIANTTIKFPAKPTGTYTLATTSDFKTINGESIIGEGNINVSGGGSQSVFAYNSVQTNVITLNNRISSNYVDLSIASSLKSNMIDLSYSDVPGSNNGTSKNNAIALGFNIKSGGNRSIVIETSSSSTDLDSVLIGNFSTVGAYAVTIGCNNTSISNQSVLIGNNNNLNQGHGISIGEFNVCNSNGNLGTSYLAPVILGRNNTYSPQTNVNAFRGGILIGDYNTSTSTLSNAIGQYLYTKTVGSTVIGRYNTNYTPVVNPTTEYVTSPTDRMFIVGIGTDNSSRADGLIILRDGTTTAPSQTNTTIMTDISGKALVTKEYVNTIVKPYKVYTALLSQSGTNAPTVIVLENSFTETITWQRSLEGVYDGVFSGNPLIDNKTAVILAPVGSSGIVGFRFGPASARIVTYNTGGSTSDSILNNTLVEIRSYN